MPTLRSIKTITRAASPQCPSPVIHVSRAGDRRTGNGRSPGDTRAWTSCTIASTRSWSPPACRAVSAASTRRTCRSTRCVAKSTAAHAASARPSRRRAPRMVGLLLRLLAGVGAGDHAVDAPAAALVDHLVDGLDGAAVDAADADEQVELAGIPALAAVDRGRDRARDLRVAAAHHHLEPRGVEHVVDRARGEGERRLEVVVPEGLELLHHDAPGVLDVGIALGAPGAGEQERGDHR